MGSQNVRLEIQKGSIFVARFRFFDTNGSLRVFQQTISGKVLPAFLPRLYFRETYEDEEPVLKCQLGNSRLTWNPEESTITLTLSALDTLALTESFYVWDLEFLPVTSIKYAVQSAISGSANDFSSFSVPEDGVQTLTFTPALVGFGANFNSFHVALVPNEDILVASGLDFSEEPSDVDVSLPSFLSVHAVPSAALNTDPKTVIVSTDQTVGAYSTLSGDSPLVFLSLNVNESGVTRQLQGQASISLEATY